jgi:parallel beta-helix repeat protein
VKSERLAPEGRRERSLKKFTLLLGVLTAVGLVLGVQQASAWQKDPDTIDPARLSSIVTQLLAPAITIGDSDTTPIGVGTDTVGIGYSLAAPPAVAPSSSDPPHTFFVDNTPLNGDCKPTTYTTIQSAVDASGPKDKIKVCPGTYPEQVRINGHNHDGLTLESLKPLQAIIQWPTTEAPPLALVDFDTVNDVKLNQFTITGPFTFPACSAERHEGILVENSSDIDIHENHITMIKNSVPSLRGCQEGDAVSIGHRIGTCSGTAPGSAHVDHNLIDDYQKNGVQVFNPGSNADVDHNEIIGPIGTVQPHAASNGVVVLCDASADVDHNEISKNHFTGSFALATSGGVIVALASGSTEVDHNLIFDNDYGIETDSQTGLEITHNDVFQHLTDGIVLCGDPDPPNFCDPAMQIVVRDNKVEDNLGSGITLIGADSNLLKSNQVERNGTAGGDTTDGLRVDSGSGGNEIRDNHMEDNVDHDCHDASTGGGTAGTANTWSGNKGDTQNRPGLCKQ